MHGATLSAGMHYGYGCRLDLELQLKPGSAIIELKPQPDAPNEILHNRIVVCLHRDVPLILAL